MNSIETKSFGIVQAHFQLWVDASTTTICVCVVCWKHMFYCFHYNRGAMFLYPLIVKNNISHKKMPVLLRIIRMYKLDRTLITESAFLELNLWCWIQLNLYWRNGIAHFVRSSVGIPSWFKLRKWPKKLNREKRSKKIVITE